MITSTASKIWLQVTEGSEVSRRVCGSYHYPRDKRALPTLRKECPYHITLNNLVRRGGLA